MNDQAFWQSLETLVAENNVTIDRLKGSAHPHYGDKYYPLNYGYLQNTQTGDGNGIDLWFGSQPEDILTGILCTYDINKRDAEIKLLLGCTPHDLEVIREFYADGLKFLFIPNPYLQR
jgi:inorganic pyrophosphatase